ncbi:MAG TPA: periplasmic heavy metal sensor [Myxococcaceae bacterium]|nr:periplasmic heavy metal sensor [Myxococcaceae bacterium]
MTVNTGPLVSATVAAALLGLTAPALAQRDAGPGTAGPGAKAPQVASPGPKHGWGMGPGMDGWGMGPGMGGWGMGTGLGGYGLGGIGLLDLSPAQRTKINAIADDLRKRQWALLGEIQDDEAKLRDLSSQPEPDPKSVGSVYVHMSKLRQQMIEARAGAIDQARAVLTPEQRSTLDRLLLEGWGPRHASRAGAKN